MADRRNLAFRVSGEDDFSKVSGQIARNAGRDMGSVQGDLDETASKGKQMAAAITAAADDVEDDLRKAGQAAEKLGEAMGPDLRSKIGESGLDDFVFELRKAGLTCEEIEADADDLAAAVKRMDDVATGAGTSTRRAFDDVEEGARRVGTETEKSRSVMANFAGNAAQDLPGVSGAFGAVNVAVGQFAEYATEGDIKLGALLKTGLAMAAVTVVIQGISSHFKEVAETKAFHRERIEDWTKSLREGKTASEALADSLEDAGKVELRLLGDTEDATEALSAAGLTMEDFSRLVLGGRDAIERWGAAQREAGNDSDAVGLAMLTADQHATDLAKAQDAAAVTAQFFGDATKKSADELTKASEVAQAHQEALDKLTDSMSEALDEMLRGTDATADWEAALDDLTSAVAENGTTLDLSTEQGRANYQAGKDAAEGLVALMQTRFQETGSIQQAITAGQGYVQQLRDQLTQAGLTAAEVQSYIDLLHLTPTEIATTFKLDTSEAVAQLQDMQRLAVDVLPNSYEVNFQAPNLRNRGPRARGGRAEPYTTGTVAEGGSPEVFMGDDGQVHLITGSRGGTIAPLPPPSAPAGLTVNVTVQGSIHSTRGLVDDLREAMARAVRAQAGGDVQRWLGQ